MRLPLGRALLAAGVVLWPTGFARAAEITLFASRPAPAGSWKTGYGASLSSTWFQALSFEGEAARQSGELNEEGMTSFTGSAFLAPPLGKLTPYGGFGLGLFRQTRGQASDTGVLRCFAVGLKLRLGIALLRGEYRRLNLSGEPLLDTGSRLSAGVGIGF